jgi:hypothetical protein
VLELVEKWFGLGDHWWVNKFPFPYFNSSTCYLWNNGEIDSKAYKGKQTDYEALMVADYEHKTLSEDWFNPEPKL